MQPCCQTNASIQNIHPKIKSECNFVHVCKYLLYTPCISRGSAQKCQIQKKNTEKSSWTCSFDRLEMGAKCLIRQLTIKRPIAARKSFVVPTLRTSNRVFELFYASRAMCVLCLLFAHAIKL